MSKEQESEYLTVSGQRIGLIKLRDIFQEVASLEINSDERITKQLLRRVRARNYVPDSAEAEYGTALLRAYRSHLGHEVDVMESAGGLVIKILGPGCPRCDQLTREVRNALAELGLAADVEHIREPKAISKFGFLATPTLIINGRVCSSGKVPTPEKIKIWLRERC
jgi:small redox-active disulfide protein 2